MFPYKFRVVWKQEDCENTSHTEFENWYLQNIQVDKSFLVQSIYSDKCGIHLNGRADKHFH